MLPQRPQSVAAEQASARQLAHALPTAKSTWQALVLTCEEQATSAQHVNLCAKLSRLGLQLQDAHCASAAGAILRQAEAKGTPFDVLVVGQKHGGLCGMNLAAVLCLSLRKRPVTVLSLPPECAHSELRGLHQSPVDVLLESGADAHSIAASLLPFLQPA